MRLPRWINRNTMMDAHFYINYSVLMLELNQPPGHTIWLLWIMTVFFMGMGILWVVRLSWECIQPFRDIVQRRIPPSFTLQLSNLLKLVFATVLLFANAYWNLYSITPSAFSVTPKYGWDFLYYSLVTFFNNGDPQPVSGMAKIATSTEMLSGWFSSTVLLALVLSLIGVEGKQDKRP